MSHRDVVAAAPAGFAVDRPHRYLRRGRHRRRGAQALRACSFIPKWSTPRAAANTCAISSSACAGATGIGIRAHRAPCWSRKSATRVGDRSVFFFVSGGVDSSVAFTLCTRALGADRVRGVYVDTGLMREGETDFVSRARRRRGAGRRASFWARSPASPIPSASATSSARSSCACRSASSKRASMLRRELDSGAGHHLPGHHRIRRHGQGRRHQDPSQPRGRHSEADRKRAHRGAAEIVL